MSNILFLHSVLNQQNVTFINSVAKHLENGGSQLTLLGWDPKKDLDLIPYKIQLPVKLSYFKIVYDNNLISSDFKKFGLDVDFLVKRFNWWFPYTKSIEEYNQRKAFLHYHLHYFLSLLSAYSPDLVLIWNGNDPRQFLLDHLCKTLDINRLFVERGTLPSLLFYDIKGVLGESTIAKFSLEEIKESNAYNNKFEEYKEWYNCTTETLWEQPEKNKEVDFKSKLGITPEKKVVLFIGQVDNDIQSKLYSPYFKSNLEAFKWFIDNNEDDHLFILGKHHPKSLISKSEYEKIIETKDNAIWTDEIPLDDCLKIADYVVAVNSSVIFDALMHDKAVLSLGFTMLDGKGILYEYEPSKLYKVLKSFYNKEGLILKIENFKKLLGYMLNNNFLFLNDEQESLRFSKELFELKKYTKVVNIDFKDIVVQSYLNNLNENRKQVVKKKSIVLRLKNRLKRIIGR